ncbi:MAG: DUF47 family protein [Prevotellaceae bacterium]|jgi:predicted phosphate transport protein (TIGR00153 family)|nr:DUF47 family protein [Prevotellaceae bacterium]
MNNSIFNKFTPKEPKFFPLLKSLADVSDKAAEQLILYIENSNNSLSQDIHQNIKDLEHRGDELTHKIFDELNITFITPFDREDINTLANKLDDVTDQIYGCSKRILFYKPEKMPDEALKLAKLVKESTEIMVQAVAELDALKKRPQTIAKYCVELHDIENKADEVFQDFIINLFETEKNAIELIKLKEVINVLEGITDETDHVGKIIKSIIVKYA